MSWSIGYDYRWKRDIGYGVTAYCDYPDCDKEINRGLSHVCGGDPYGGNLGCGLYFCDNHHRFDDNHSCERCSRDVTHFPPKPDHPDWIKHKLTDESWQEWRDENSDEVEALKGVVAA